MVAEPHGGPAVDPQLGQHALQHTTDVSNLYKNTFVWNPRQQPERVEAFQAQAAELLRKRSIPGWVLKGPPTRQEKRDANPNATKDEIEDAHAKAMLVYQLYNTAVWDLISPTVSLAGAYQELDERHQDWFHFVKRYEAIELMCMAYQTSIRTGSNVS